MSRSPIFGSSCVLQFCQEYFRQILRQFVVVVQQMMDQKVRQDFLTGIYILHTITYIICSKLPWIVPQSIFLMGVKKFQRGIGVCICLGPLIFVKGKQSITVDLSKGYNNFRLTNSSTNALVQHFSIVLHLPPNLFFKNHLTVICCCSL